MASQELQADLPGARNKGGLLEVFELLGGRGISRASGEKALLTFLDARG